MSCSFFYFFKYCFTTCGELFTHKNVGYISSLGLGGHICYVYGTKQEKDIIVSKKYKFDRNGSTEFMIVDSQDNHYNVNNSLWYWKWNSIEDWSSIEANTKINSKYYGLRVPILGLFPNIVSCQNNKNTKIYDIPVKSSIEQDLSDGIFS